MTLRIKKPLLRVPVRSSISFFAFSMVTKAITLAVTPVFTRLLSSEEYALTPLYMTWLSLFGTLITLELTGSVLLSGMQKYKKDVESFLSSSLTLLSLPFLFFLLLYVLFHRKIDQLTGLSLPLTLLLFMQTAANVTLSLYHAKARFFYQPKAALPSLLATSLLAPIGAILLIYFTPIRAEARILASAVVSIAVAAPIAVRILKRGRCIYNREMWKSMLRSALPLFPHYLSLSALSEVGRVFVNKFDTPSSLSKLQIGATIAHGVTMLIGAVNAAFYPWLLRRVSEGETGRIRKMADTVLQVVALSGIAVLFIAPEALSILAPPDYQDGIRAIAPLVYATLPAFLYTLFAGVTLNTGKTARMTVASILSAAIGIGANYILVRRFGFVGAAWASVISYLILSLSHGFVTQKSARFLPVSIGKCLSLLLFTLITAILIPYLQALPAIRYLLLGADTLLLLDLGIRERKVFMEARA